jgi:hypothetical protein
MSFEDHLNTPTAEPLKPNSGGLLDEVKFPVEAFPVEYQNIIEQAARILGSDPCHLGTGILGAFGLSIGNTLRVTLAPHFDPIPATTWMVLVEQSGGGKGRAQSFSYKPLEKFDEARRVKTSNDRADLEKKIWNTRTLMNASQSPDQKADYKKEIEGLNRELENIEDKYLMITDITMEAVRTANLKNRRGIGYVRDEVSGFYNSFGKYSKGGGSSTSEESFYIETYDGKPLIPFRSGAKSQVCDYPFTSVFGGTQPGTLGDLGKNNRMISGFVFRFMFSYPQEKPLGKRKREDYQFDAKIKEVMEQYDSLINRVLDGLQMDFKDEGKIMPNPKIVVFSDEALQKYIEFQNAQADFANNLNVDARTREVVKSIVTRLDMNLFRLCLIMETMKWALGHSSLDYITGNTVTQCVKLMDYYRYTMLKVYSEVESIRFEQGSKRPKRTQFVYKKVFTGRKELSRDELYKRLHELYGVSVGTAEKYVLEDEKQQVPPILSAKDGRMKIYYLNDFKSE